MVQDVVAEAVNTSKLNLVMWVSGRSQSVWAWEGGGKILHFRRGVAGMRPTYKKGAIASGRRGE